MKKIFLIVLFSILLISFLFFLAVEIYGVPSKLLSINFATSFNDIRSEYIGAYKMNLIHSVFTILSYICLICVFSIKIYDLAKEIRGTVDKSAKDNAKRAKLQAKLDELNKEKTE